MLDRVGLNKHDFPAALASVLKWKQQEYRKMHERGKSSHMEAKKAASIENRENLHFWRAENAENPKLSGQETSSKRNCTSIPLWKMR